MFVVLDKLVTNAILVKDIYPDTDRQSRPKTLRCSQRVGKPFVFRFHEEEYFELDKERLIVKLVFQNPMGKTEEFPKLETLQKLIFEPPHGYWDQGSGGANLDYLKDTSRTSLMICPSSQYGIYLRFYDAQGVPWLSVEDKSKLLEWTDLSDEWYVSVGLFIQKESAWLAVKEFCSTGKRAPEVNWLPASEIPEGGNW